MKHRLNTSEVIHGEAVLEIGRGLQRSGNPRLVCFSVSHPERVPENGLLAANNSATPSGWRSNQSYVPGVSEDLNPRLISGNPPGCPEQCPSNGMKYAILSGNPSGWLWRINDENWAMKTKVNPPGHLQNLIKI